MLDLTAQNLIRQLHRSPWKLDAAVTGGGTQAISHMLATPGASDTVIEAIVPYSAEALVDFLGMQPSQYCSRPTALAMAMQAFFRARQLESKEHEIPSDEHTLLGVSCSASLKSLRPKQGEHRAHVAIQSAEVSSIASLVLNKDARTREEEEQVVAAIILNRIAEATGIADRVSVDLLPGERIDESSTKACPSWTQLLLGQVDAVCGNLSDQDSALDSFSGVLFPGAFNPLHEGHQRMAEVAEEITGHRVDFEISMENVDKPPLDFFAIDRRMKQFDPSQRCWLTRAPTFLSKAAIFPEATFVVGADTIIRIAEAKYYNRSIQQRDNALDELCQQNCRFLVFPRLVKGELLSSEDIQLPQMLADRCEFVSPDRFRVDISSTELRKGTPVV